MAHDSPMAPPYVHGDTVVLVTTIGMNERCDVYETVVCRVHIEDKAGRVVNTGYGFPSRHDADTFRNGAHLALRAVGIAVGMRVDGGPKTLRILDERDGEEQTCTYEAFVEANEDSDFLDAIGTLQIGQRVDLGDGAYPSVVVERIS